MMCWEVFKKFLQCVKTGTKRGNERNFYQFIWLLDNEIKF